MCSSEFNVVITWTTHQMHRECKKMIILVEDFFEKRKYPFIFTLLVLLICVMILLFANTTITNPLVYYSIVKEESPLNHSPSPVPAASPTNPKDQKYPQK